VLGFDGLRVRTVLRLIRPRLSRRSSAFGFLATLTVVVGLLFASSPTASGLSVSNTDQILTTTGGGALIPLTSDGTIQLIRGHSVSITGTGFAADEDVNAWLFSDPILVGNTRTSGKGTVRDSFVVPAVTTNGNHTLQIRLVSPEGKIVNFGLPVVVVEDVADGGACAKTTQCASFTHCVVLRRGILPTRA